MYLRNKKVISIILSIVLLLGIMVAPGVSMAAEPESLTIVHVNDVHGALKYNEGSGQIGFGRLQTKLNELKDQNPNLLLMNAGDSFHGDVDVNLSNGQIMVDMMNLLGFDVMVPGNHDFNYGYDRLLEIKKAAEFPILGANIIKEADGKSDFEGFVVKEMENGLKVGIFGITTEETKFKTHPDNTEGIEFADGVETAKKMVKQLKDKDVDLIVALVHLGNEGTTLTTSRELAQEVDGIDLIIDGHSHENLNETVNGALLVQVGNFLKNIGVVNVEIVDGKITKIEEKPVTFEEAKAIVPDEATEVAIAAALAGNAEKKSEVVGKTNVALDGLRANVRTGETNLGNLITDAMRKSTGADIAFTNGGGIRASIDEGDITFEEIITAFPFTNTLAVIEVTGAELKAALEHGVDLYPEQAGHFPHVSGMTYKFDAGKAVGNRVVEVSIGKEALDETKTYKLVTNDFLAAGGDGYTMFKGKPFVAEGGLLSDVLISYVKAEAEVSPAVEGRITIIPAPVAEPAPEPEPTPAPAPTPAADIKYTVVKGDWLSKIALRYNKAWQDLAEYNKIKNPNLIYPGQIILIPQ